MEVWCERVALSSVCVSMINPWAIVEDEPTAVQYIPPRNAANYSQLHKYSGYQPGLGVDVLFIVSVK